MKQRKLILALLKTKGMDEELSTPYAEVRIVFPLLLFLLNVTTLTSPSFFFVTVMKQFQQGYQVT